MVILVSAKMIFGNMDQFPRGSRLSHSSAGSLQLTPSLRGSCIENQILKEAKLTTVDRPSPSPTQGSATLS